MLLNRTLSDAFPHFPFIYLIQFLPFNLSATEKHQKAIDWIIHGQIQRTYLSMLFTAKQRNNIPSTMVQTLIIIIQRGL